MNNDLNREYTLEKSIYDNVKKGNVLLVEENICNFIDIRLSRHNSLCLEENRVYVILERIISIMYSNKIESPNRKIFRDIEQSNSVTEIFSIMHFYVIFATIKIHNRL